MLAGACFALSELFLSGVRMPGPAIMASLGLILVGALIEGIITVAVIRAMERVNPGWIRSPGTAGKPVLGVFAIAALVLVTLGGLIASSSPDTLEHFAEQIGISDRARNLLQAPLADYGARFGSNWLAQAAAGLAGLALIFVLCVTLGKLLAMRSASRAPVEAGRSKGSL